MYTERGTISADFVYNLRFWPSLALSHIDYIQYTLYLQQLAYRLMEGGAILYTENVFKLMRLVWKCEWVTLRLPWLPMTSHPVNIGYSKDREMLGSLSARVET